MYEIIIKKLPFLKAQTEMLFLFIKDYHRVESDERFNLGIPSISEEVTDWIDKTWIKYKYDYRPKSNLFNLDSLYRNMPKKSFIKGRKQEFEILFMYYWLHYMEGDEDYWQDYLEEVLPALKKQ